MEKEKLQPINTKKGEEQRDKIRDKLLKKADEEHEAKFDLTKIYFKNYTPKEIAEYISRLENEELQMVVLPTSEKGCDIIIREIPK